MCARMISRIYRDQEMLFFCTSSLFFPTSLLLIWNALKRLWLDDAFVIFLSFVSIYINLCTMLKSGTTNLCIPQIIDDDVILKKLFGSLWIGWLETLS